MATDLAVVARRVDRASDARYSEEHMLEQDFLSKLNAFVLSASDCQELDEVGFTIIPGPVPVDGLTQLAAAYDAAVDNAVSDDIKVGSSTTRVRGFVNRGPEFDGLYLHPPVLKACCHIIGKRRWSGLYS